MNHQQPLKRFYSQREKRVDRDFFSFEQQTFAGSHGRIRTI